MNGRREPARWRCHWYGACV